MINSIHLQLLRILSDVLGGRSADGDDKSRIPSEDRGALAKLAAESIRHSVYPLFVDGIRQAGGSAEPALRIPESYRELYNSEICRQAQKTADFLLFYEYLASKDLHPVVMKGIVCRDLYAQPEHRASSDEDLLIDPSRFSRIHRAILDYGLEPVKTGENIRKASEVSYEDKEKHLYIEVHKTLFEEDSKACGDLNKCFEGALGRSTTQVIYGTTLYVLDPTDHVLYIILHALKHFLYSGFGIRQVCDLILFAERYRDGIDWSRVTEELEKARALDFARALFRIGDRYLLTENHMQDYLADWRIDLIDEGPLLADIMEGGLYGASSMARLHSSNMTLVAVESEKSSSRPAKRAGRPVIRSVFLPLKKMRDRYPYLKVLPFLLPVAWVQRIVRYLFEKRRGQRRNIVSESAESIRLGKERIKLLEQYHIIQGRD